MRKAFLMMGKNVLCVGWKPQGRDNKSFDVAHDDAAGLPDDETYVFKHRDGFSVALSMDEDWHCRKAQNGEWKPMVGCRVRRNAEDFDPDIHYSRKALVETAIRAIEADEIKWAAGSDGGVTIRLDKKQADTFLKAINDNAANKLYECGFDMDELTAFVLARDEMEAKGKYVESVAEMLNDAEEPGWEDRVWCEDLSERVLL